METRVVRAAVVLLSLGTMMVTTPAVGAHGPTVGGETGRSAVVDGRDVPAGNRTARPGKAASSAPGTLLGSDRAREGRPATGGGTLNVSYAYRRLPAERGVVEVTMRVPATPGIDRVRFGFEAEATVVRTENVVRNGSVYEWTGEESGVIVYHLRIDWSYTGNSGDSWVLLEHLPPTIRPETAVGTNEAIELADRGYVGNETMLLGAHAVYRRQVDGERIHLVVPGNRSLRFGPRRTVDALANASRSLEIGARDDVVHAFATPEIRTEATILEFDGFALDGSTILVDADAELAAWIHEYVHTRQAFSNEESLRWMTEGSARYYEWLLAVESGYADWGELRGVFAEAANDDSVLAEPDTWGGESNYAKGALVLAAVDREIRAATDGTRTLEDAIRRLNGRDTDPTAETFVRAVRRVGGPNAAATAERYVTTRRVPDLRTETEEFEAVYGHGSPQIRERVVSTSASGSDGTRQIRSTDGRIPLGLDETFRLTVRVENTGSARGLGAVTPRLSTDRLGGDYVDSTWTGWVAPGESVTRTVSHRFGRPGLYDVTRNGDRYDVRVAPNRGTASVAGLNVTGVRTDDGRALVEVTVRNDGDRPTFVTLPVTVDGRRVSTTALVLDGDETRTLAVRVDVPPPAPATVTVGSATTAVETSGTATPTAMEPSSGSGPATTVATDGDTFTTEPEGGRLEPGLPVPLVLVALIGIVGLWRWTSRRR
jgi:hypothetical protein